MDRRSNSFQYLSPGNYFPGSGQSEGQCSRRQQQHPLHNSKSLPNIEIPQGVGGCFSGSGAQDDTDHDAPTGGKRERHRKRLLQKTWDKVKTIITHSSSSSQVGLLRRRNSSSGKGKSSGGATATASGSCSATNSPNTNQAFEFEPVEPEPDHDQVLDHYIRLQRRLSDELHQSMMQQRESRGGGGGQQQQLSADFKKKLQQWDMWRASTGKHKYTEQELQQLIPQDYAKKLEEWEQIKSGGAAAVAAAAGIGQKSKNKTKDKDKEKEKELAWLEKQLTKVEREKQRLELQLRKCAEKEVELKRMKDAMVIDIQMKEGGYGPSPALLDLHIINQDLINGALRTLAEKALPLSSAEPPQPPARARDRARARSSSTSSSACSVHGGDVDYEDPDEFDESYSKSRATSTDSTDAKPVPGLGNTVAGFRRSSDATTSTPLSTRSLSGFESDDGEFGILKTVSEELNEEKEKAVVGPRGVNRVEPVVIEDDFCANDEDDQEACSAIVPTKRTIFKPVSDCEVNARSPIDLRSPALVRNMIRPQPIDGQSANAPKIVGVIRKTGGGGGSPLAKIPVWCSPMLSRRASGPKPDKFTFTPSSEFSIDKFLEESNLLPSTPATTSAPPPVKAAAASKPPLSLQTQLPPIRPSRIPISSPLVAKRKIVNSLMQRSNSFQGPRSRPAAHQPPEVDSVERGQTKPDTLQTEAPPPIPKVCRSRSTGTILGQSHSRLVTLAQKFGIGRPTTAAEGNEFSWLKK